MPNICIDTPSLILDAINYEKNDKNETINNKIVIEYFSCDTKPQENYSDLLTEKIYSAVFAPQHEGFKFIGDFKKTIPSNLLFNENLGIIAWQKCVSDFVSGVFGLFKINQQFTHRITNSIVKKLEKQVENFL